jgi:protein-S-isoprenylcysteine O-methyltransferase Ste14
VRFPPPFVFLGLIGLGVGLQRWLWPITSGVAFWPRVLVGTSVAALGAMMILSAQVWFKRSGQHPAPWKPSPELLVKGVYRYTRNPMYVGMTLFQLGLGIALDNVWVATLSPLALAVIHVIAVKPEEAYLTEKFGESYVRYTAAVRRYL